MQITKHSYLPTVLARRCLSLTVLLLLSAAGSLAIAQSPDRDNPTALSTNIIKGTGAGKKVEYYYSFTAGPGEVVITIDLKAKISSTVADIEIFNADSNKIFYYYPNATTTNERSVKTLNLGSKQILTLRLALDSQAGDFQIKLGGAVEFPAAETSAGATTPPVDTTASQPAESTAQPNPAATAAGQTSSEKSGKGSKLDVGIDLLQTVGTHFGLPTSGTLHIVMKDGTTQDIDLSQVKSASVKKP